MAVTTIPGGGFTNESTQYQRSQGRQSLVQQINIQFTSVTNMANFEIKMTLLSSLADSEEYKKRSQMLHLQAAQGA
jgi:hypothetical protein